MEETLWLGTGYIKQIHKISKYTEGKRSQVSPYLRMLIHLQKRRDWLNLRWSHSHEFWFIIENSMFSHINTGPTLTHTHMQTPCTHTCIHVYTHINTQSSRCTCWHTYVCVCAQCVHAYSPTFSSSVSSRSRQAVTPQKQHAPSTQTLVSNYYPPLKRTRAPWKWLIPGLQQEKNKKAWKIFCARKSRNIP